MRTLVQGQKYLVFVLVERDIVGLQCLVLGAQGLVGKGQFLIV